MGESHLLCSYNEEEVTKQVTLLRASLSKKPRPIDPYSSDSHMIAEASEAKKKQLKNAFGIREDYVEGSAFNQEAQKLRAAQEKEEREAKTEYACTYILCIYVHVLGCVKHKCILVYTIRNVYEG